VTDPASLLVGDEARLWLATHDLTRVFRRLVRGGVSQRQIADLTGQRPASVAEIVDGRQVQAYGLLVRIADGLVIPRGHMGLAFDDETAGIIVAAQLSPGTNRPTVPGEIFKA
jgi:hypothetical protein